MFYLNNRLVSCCVDHIQMDSLGNSATHIAFKSRYLAYKTLHNNPTCDVNFYKWARSQQIKNVPFLFEIVRQTMLECHHYILGLPRWSQFVQWRQNVCGLPMHTDTLGSIYTTFLYWNKHIIPKRRPIHTINTLSTIQKHPINLTPLSNPVVQSQSDDVINQRVRQCTPSMRFPTRSHSALSHTQPGKLLV